MKSSKPSLQDFSGNSALKKTLHALIGARRFPHAVLFFGQPGCGVNALATAFGADLLAATMPNREEWVKSAVQEGAYPDFYTLQLTDKKTISVDAVRQMLAELYVTPNEGSHKVYYIKDAQHITPQGQNALLKALEEPPAHAVFVVTADSRQHLLPTILSRLTHYEVLPPSRREALDYFTVQGHTEQELDFPCTVFQNRIGDIARYLAGEGDAKGELADGLSLLGLCGEGKRAEVYANLLKLRKRDELAGRVSTLISLLPFVTAYQLGSAAPPPDMPVSPGLKSLPCDKCYGALRRTQGMLKQNGSLALLTADLAGALCDR